MSSTSLWSNGLFAITIYADDLVVSRKFYGEMLQMQEIFSNHDSVVYQMGSACLNVLMKENAPELVEPLPIAPSSAGSRSLLTVTVDDVDAAHAALAEFELEPGLPKPEFRRPLSDRVPALGDF